MTLDIKRAAREHGKTLKEVADNMQTEKNGKRGVTAATLSQHINGNPSVKVLQAIADSIGCKVTELFYEEGDQNESKGQVTVLCPHCGKPLHIQLTD